MSWWDRVKTLFQEAETSTPTAPAVHEVLTRHKTEAEAYAAWRDGLIRTQLTDWLREQYGFYLTDRSRQDEAIDFLDTPSSKGFVIHFSQTQYSLREAEFLHLYLRERVLSRPYRTQAADSRTYTKNGRTERTDRYYLKPRPDWSHPDGGEMDGHTANQFEQQFGNILINLVVRNGRPHQLRLSATVYHDRVYKDAKGFGGLMEVLL